METALPSGPGARRCPTCSSTDIRRSMPRNGRERLLRTLLPVHLFFCRNCEQRSWIWVGSASSRRSSHPRRREAGREMEARDRALARRMRHRLLRSAFLALLLGAILGLYVTNCQERRHALENAPLEQAGTP